MDIWKAIAGERDRRHYICHRSKLLYLSLQVHCNYINPKKWLISLAEPQNSTCGPHYYITLHILGEE